MSRTGGLSAAPADPLYFRPWVVLVAGLVLVAVGLGLAALESHAAAVARAWFLVAGLLTAGAAISRRLRTAGWDLEERLGTAGLIAAGAFVALVAYLAIKKNVETPDGKTVLGDDWTSAELFLIGLIIIALAGAALVALPSLPRKVLLSFLFVFHFGGILVAGLNVPSGATGEPPWLTNQLWVHVYRYYLNYIYMTNAYHFYSPDPGPSTLVWFRVQYDDDSYHWVQMPDKKGSRVPLQYTRSMVIADSTGLAGPQPPPYILARRIRDRREAGVLFAPERTKDDPHPTGVHIPISLEDLVYGVNAPIPPEAYKEPNEYSRRLIASYVRYVSKNYPNEQNPSIAVKNVKVYRITHKLIGANEMARGFDPGQEIFLYPYFMGKYDTHGELIDKQLEYDAGGRPKQEYDEFGRPKPYDGFLYWVMPILAVPKGRPAGDFNMPWEAKEYTTRNYMRLHAGDIRSFDDDKKDEPKKEEGR
jgi:hypothetical protein